LIDSDLPKWQTTNSKYLVKDRWITLRADSCTTPAGHTIEPYYVLEYLDWVNCFVIDKNLDMLLVNNYRHAINAYVLEPIGGGIEPGDTSPEKGVRRELEEELGYSGGTIYSVGASYPNAASHSNKVHSFFAFGGEITQPHQHEKGETMTILRIPLREALAMILGQDSSRMYQSTHLASLLMTLNFIKRSNIPELQKVKDAIKGEQW